MEMSEILAYRCLFGSITHLTTDASSKFGSFDSFLSHADTQILLKMQSKLTMKSVHTFIKTMCQVEGEHPLLLLIDEANAASIAPSKVDNP